MLDGGLSDAEMKRLASLLESIPGGQEHFTRLCELHAMLDSDEQIEAALASDFLPENVVSMSGTKSTGLGGVPDPLGRATVGARVSSLVWIGAAAAVLIAAVTFFAFRPVPKTTPEIAVVPAANTVPMEQVVEDPAEEAPETQYERAVLASLGSGSQKRPPTNFTVTATADGPISFNKHIRPVLSENCYACHGPDEASREADLRLDTFEGATGGESPAIVVGNPKASEFIARITASDEDDIMPPPDSHKSLTPAQIELLTRWVEDGAEWEDHWSFMPITSNVPDEVKGSPIDYFVDRELAANGLTRSPEAERTTLIRRASLDLTGLPPTPAEVEAFLNDESKEAYEKLIDELMARPSFGEHRARYWLDAARYADTHGLHLDNIREIWPYRDWVIGAFNANMPFDQFTIEQLAGDLLPEPTQEQQIATGFNRCNVTTSEGGAIEEEFLVRYAVDRVSTTATVWMGLTAGCAQCHDHKFDPITMKDFYSLFAFFNNTTQPGMDGNAKDSPPVVRVFDSKDQEAKAKDLEAKVGVARKKVAEALKEFDPDSTSFDAVAPELIDAGQEPEPTTLGDTGNFGKEDAFTAGFRYMLPQEDGRIVLAERVDPENNDRGWRIVWEDRGMIVELIESYPDKILKRGMTRRFKPGSSGYFAFTYDGSGRSEGIRIYLNGDLQGSRFINEWHDSLETDFSTENANLLIGGSDPSNALPARVTEFYFENRRLSDAEMKALGEHYTVLRIADKDPEKRNDKEKGQLKNYLAAWSEGPYRTALKELESVETELLQIQSATPTTLVMHEKDEEPKAHLLMRGEYEQKGDEVAPAFPAFLPEIGSELPMNRLGLAKWLVHEDHPLTARVAVNRMWQELFGTGLVKTAEDFGTQGENPSHPELLDWLAATLIESGWDMKSLYKTIMMSETYRQSSKVDETLAKNDPDNRLLARGPRFRLDAEVIRDQALAASGLLDPAVGGPGVRPYQPAGIWEAVGYTNSNTQTFFQDFGPSAEHRRSLYSFWKRTAPPPNLSIFDAPNRESCIMRRERTNTPLQALVLMNDPQFVRASRYLALRVLGESNDRDERLDRMAELLRGKPLTEDERRIVVNSLDQFLNTYGSDQEAAAHLLVDDVNPSFTIEAENEAKAPELAAWTMVANQMLNLDEVITKN